MASPPFKVASSFILSQSFLAPPHLTHSITLTITITTATQTQAIQGGSTGQNTLVDLNELEVRVWTAGAETCREQARLEPNADIAT